MGCHIPSSATRNSVLTSLDLILSVTGVSSWKYYLVFQERTRIKEKKESKKAEGEPPKPLYF
jgi:hypothetical protein